MMMRRYIYCIMCIVALSLVLLAGSACAGIIEAGMPDRIPVSIFESEKITEKERCEFSSCVFVSEDIIEIRGTFDADYVPVFMINGMEADDIGSVVITDNDGNWCCSIPVSALNASDENVFSVYYEDRADEAMNCFIYVDAECALSVENVYESDEVICGTADPGATVTLYSDEEEICTAAADENGVFVLEFGISAKDNDAGYVVAATDEGGNCAEAAIEIIDTDIAVSAPLYSTTGTVSVNITAIPGSSVQIYIDGKPSGHLVDVDEHGFAECVIDGIDDGVEYSITAAYTGEFEELTYTADSVSVISDSTVPVLISGTDYLDTASEWIDINVSEECVLYISEKTTNFVYDVQCEAGDKRIAFAELPREMKLEEGMEFYITAVDTAGNESETISLRVIPDEDEALFIDGMYSGTINVLDAMKDVDISGFVLVEDTQCMLRVIVSGDDRIYFETDVSEMVVETVYAEKMSAVIPVDVVISRFELPADTVLTAEFCVLDEFGNEVYGTERLQLQFRLEKNRKWLAVRVIFLAAVIACFVSALILYTKAARKQRILRRDNGIRRRKRAGKRGGA